MADDSEPMKSKFKNQSAGEELDRRTLIFMQCNRINQIISAPVATKSMAQSRSEMLSNALDALEAMLIPNMTEKMDKNIDKIYEAAANSIKSIVQGYPKPEDFMTVTNEMFIWSKVRYKELWRIMKKSNLLPMRTVKYKDTEDNDEETDYDTE